MHFKPLTIFWILISYSVCLISLGIFGYYKTSSTASLYSSLGFGSLILGNSYFFLKEKKWAILTARVLLFSLCLVFAFRFLATQKTTPAVMGLLSFLALNFVWKFPIRKIHSLNTKSK